jgi:hypothetical protein
MARLNTPSRPYARAAATCAPKTNRPRARPFGAARRGHSLPSHRPPGGRAAPAMIARPCRAGEPQRGAGQCWCCARGSPPPSPRSNACLPWRGRSRRSRPGRPELRPLSRPRPESSRAGQSPATAQASRFISSRRPAGRHPSHPQPPRQPRAVSLSRARALPPERTRATRPGAQATA